MESLGFEQALVGTILAAPERINDLEVAVLPSDFSAISNQVLWEKIVPLCAGGQLSKIAMVETLRAVGLLENLGQDVGSAIGEAYIDKLCSMASPQSAVYFSEQVVDASIKRQMGQSVALTKIDLEENKTADEILDAAEGRLWEMRRQKSPMGSEIGDLLGILDVTIDDYRSGKKVPSYVVKNRDLGRIIPFLEDQDYMIVGARPGVGKSSLMRSEAFQSALEGVKVCIVNMDNGEIDYTRYLVAYATGINSTKLRNPKTLSQEELARAKSAIQDLKRLPIRIITLGSPSVEIVLAAMKKAFSDGYQVFMVDYIQQIQNKGMQLDPVQNISYSSSQLRGFNMKYSVPVIVASQFNREIAHRAKDKEGADPEPTLSDFKGSGSLEQDATVAVAIGMENWDPMMLARFPENLVMKNGRQQLAPPNEIRIAGVKFYVLKFRNGPTGKTLVIKWDKATNTYSPLEMAEAPMHSQRRGVRAGSDTDD